MVVLCYDGVGDTPLRGLDETVPIALDLVILSDVGVEVGIRDTDIEGEVLTLLLWTIEVGEHVGDEAELSLEFDDLYLRVHRTGVVLLNLALEVEGTVLHQEVLHLTLYDTELLGEDSDTLIDEVGRIDSYLATHLYLLLVVGSHLRLEDVQSTLLGVIA